MPRSFCMAWHGIEQDDTCHVCTRSGMVESAFEFADICRKHDYHNFVFSMKASNPLVMVQVGVGGALHLLSCALPCCTVLCSAPSASLDMGLGQLGSHQHMAIESAQQSCGREDVIGESQHNEEGAADASSSLLLASSEVQQQPGVPRALVPAATAAHTDY